MKIPGQLHRGSARVLLGISASFAVNGRVDYAWVGMCRGIKTFAFGLYLITNTWLSSVLRNLLFLAYFIKRSNVYRKPMVHWLF